MTASLFNIRPARPDDIPAIAAADRALWQDWANPVTLYRQLLELYPELCFVAQAADGSYAGCAFGLLRPDPSTGLVLCVDIPKIYQHQGLGRLLLAELLRVFRRLNTRTVLAIIDPANIPSQKLFAAFSFTMLGLERDYFGAGFDQQRWVCRLS